jgi:hypothetical protein
MSPEEEELEEEAEGVREGVLRSIVRSIFLRHRSREAGDQHVKQVERIEDED